MLRHFIFAIPMLGLPIRLSAVPNCQCIGSGEGQQCRDGCQNDELFHPRKLPLDVLAFARKVRRNLTIPPRCLQAGRACSRAEAGVLSKAADGGLDVLNRTTDRSADQ
jgi:hypothetical protein